MQIRRILSKTREPAIFGLIIMIVLWSVESLGFVGTGRIVVLLHRTSFSSVCVLTFTYLNLFEIFNWKKLKLFYPLLYLCTHK